MENKTQTQIALTDGQALPVVMLAKNRAGLIQEIGQLEDSLRALASAYAGAAGQEGQWDFQQVDGGKLVLVRIDAPAPEAAPTDVTE